MATLLQRSATFRDVDKMKKTLLTLNSQRNFSQFCDVVLRVCGTQIFAHASVLSAASPYFSSFLGIGADCPRPFSQKQPQIIEIHIDNVLISEGDGGYGEAVGRVVEYMYTNEIIITANLFSQIIEIGRIMLLDQLLLYCEEFQKGAEGNMPKAVSTCTSTLREVVDILGYQSAKGNKMSDAQTETEDTLFAKVDNNNDNVSSDVQTVTLSSSEFDLLFSNDANVATISIHDTNVDDSICYDAAEKKSESLTFSTKDESSSSSADVTKQMEVTDALVKLEVEDDKLGALSDESKNSKVLPTESEPEENFNAIKSFEDILDCNSVSVSAVASCGIIETVENKSTEIKEESDSQPVILDENISEVVTDVELADISDLVTFNTVSKNTNPTKVKSRGTGRPRGRPKKGKRGRPKGRREVDRSTEYDAESDYEFERFIVKLEKGENVETQDNEGVTTENNDLSATPKCPNTENHLLNVKKSDRIRSRPSQLKKDYILHSMRRKTRKKYGSTLADRANNKLRSNEKDNSKYNVLRFMCQNCDYSTTVFKAYCEHLNAHPDLELKSLHCPDCDFKTAKSRLFKKHKEKHLAEKLICILCDFQAADATEFKEHKSKHSGNLPFFCNECDSRFKKKCQLESHKPKHWVERPFTCPVCKAGFKWKHALKNHMVTHTTVKDHLCDICGYATAHKSMLTAHQLVHTGETFKCSVEGCHFEATKRQKLKMHMLTHTREKPHQCEVCGQRFSLAKNMRRHTLLHTNTRPFACKICSFTTTRYDKLKEHNHKSHNIGGPSVPKKPKLEDTVVGPLDGPATVTVVTTEDITLNPDGSISAESLQKIAEIAAAQQNTRAGGDNTADEFKEAILKLDQPSANGSHAVPIMAHIQFSEPDAVDADETTTRTIKFVPEME